MPNHTRLAVCPYYLSDNDKSVTCEDTIRQFRTRELKRSYLQEYCCCFRWKDCPYARALDQVYEKISAHPEEAESIYYEHHRIHHHVVMSYIDLPVITTQWTRGRVRCTALDRSRSYRALADYLIKETQKTFRDPDNATKRRWKASRNLKRPVVKREWVSVRELWRDPKPLKGYQLDKDSVRYYQNPITGLEHLEYQMISIDPVPRLKTWRRGKAIKRQETYVRMEKLRQDDINSGEDEGTWKTC